LTGLLTELEVTDKSADLLTKLIKSPLNSLNRRPSRIRGIGG